MEFYKGVLGKWPWSLSYKFFVKLSLYNMIGLEQGLFLNSAVPL